MIPLAFIQAWRARAPWPDLRQVEQDLIICRALCDLFSAPALEGKLAWSQLIGRIKGDAWKSSAEAIHQLRTQKHPLLLP
jgi:hypothetical protein